jgi:RsiW-degrading membrane proteinase PrsW (M82 family)
MTPHGISGRRGAHRPDGMTTLSPESASIAAMRAVPPISAPRSPEAHETFVLIPTRVWKLMLVVGAFVWIVAAVVTEVTNDNILVPTVIIVGSFMVPATVAAFALSRDREGYLTTEEVLLGFLAAGTLGVVATALLEVYLLPAATGTFIGVGIIEELGKGAVLLAVAHQVHHREPRDGMVLGAVVGAGFAAFESSGYALQSMLNHIDERPLINILETEAFRAVLTPFGHITWTALLGGALFASSRAGRFHVTRRLVGTFVGVVTLHAIWDQTYGWAVMLSKGVTGVGWSLIWPNAEFWAVEPSARQLIWFNVFYDGILAIVALIGLTWVLREWHVYGHWRTARQAA